LAEFFGPVNEYRRLAHFVDGAAKLRRALHSFDEKVDEDRLPIGADEIEH
jgi:hypothetical protein